MALVTDRSLFLHVPKTGGIWLRQVYRACGIEHKELGQQHSHFPELLQYGSDDYYSNLYSFAFIRHPLSWYQSRWAFRVKNGWRVQHPLDYHCASNDFATFVENVLRYKPTGWVTHEFNNYLNNVPGGIKFVGRIESLVTDILTIFKEANESFDEAKIRSVPRLNESDLDGKPSKYWAKYTPALAERVINAEYAIISKYYKDYYINPSNLFGRRPY